MPLCDYGCGQEAKYQFKNGKWCCSSYFAKCPEVIRKNSQSNKNTWQDPNSVFNTEEYREKVRQSNMGKSPWNKGKTKEDDNRILKQSNSLKDTWKDPSSYLNSCEYRETLLYTQNREDVKIKKSFSMKKSISYWIEKYPFCSDRRPRRRKKG